MIEETKTEAKVSVGVEALWKALAKDMTMVTPKVVPDLVKNVEVIEGDGGVGTVLLFNLGSDVSNMSYQKEKIVDLDESVHKIGLQVIEGGHLNMAFLHTRQVFNLLQLRGRRLWSVSLSPESEVVEDSTMPFKTIMSALAFIRNLESYLLNGATYNFVLFQCRLGC